MADMYIEFIRVMNLYCNKMPVYKGHKYIGRFSPEDGIELIKDMELIGIIFMGVEIWYPYYDWVAENYWDDFTVDSSIYDLPNASQISAELCRKYILNEMPQNIKYVSFIFRIPLDWDWQKQVCNK